jgi:hypothetical protein
MPRMRILRMSPDTSRKVCLKDGSQNAQDHDRPLRPRIPLPVPTYIAYRTGCPETEP